jgi:MoaA/NifB/PqqE/SkfB family radical SAM enzyme
MLSHKNTAIDKIKMSISYIAKKLLANRHINWPVNFLIRLFYCHRLRESLYRLLDKHLERQLDRSQHINDEPDKIVHQRKLMYSAILSTIDRLINKRLIDPEVARKVALLWSRALLVSPDKAPGLIDFRNKNGADPPWLITISPGHSCNLKCKGCYADSNSSGAKLKWSVLEHIVHEAKELWGIRLVVFSGGEPLLYRSEGKGVLDIVERNPDVLFLMFTNGTLVDEEIADRLSRLGNLTPAFSVEGMQKRTDDCRGSGIFNSVINGIELVRKAGVPFGISVSVTRENCEEIVSDEFLNLFFEELGAFYAFFFQYLPIGRKPDFESMPTPAQRIGFWHQVWEIVEKKKLFLVDFWNHGPLVGGCISAGRAGGYIYIDWNGNIMPCVFTPYSAGNINSIYTSGGTLNDVWHLPFFKAIRSWQRSYGYGKPHLLREGNLLSPCPFRDHHEMFRSWINEYRPEPEDESAQETLFDEHYYKYMVNYGSNFRKLSQEIWEREYLKIRQ